MSPKSRVLQSHRLYVILLLLAAAPLAQAADWVYSMRPGDNLWDFSERYLKSVAYVDALARRNQIEDPYNIPPGTRIRVPVKWSVLEPAPVMVEAVRGDVQVRPAAGAPLHALETGTQLQLENEVVSGDGGNALLRFADGSVLNLRDNSTLSLDTLSAFGDSGMVDSRVRLLKGRAELKVRKKPEGDSYYQVDTPSALNVVRGTEFRVHIDEEEPAVRTEVTEGRVGVSAQGVSRSVPENYGVVVGQGKAPSPPRPLLGAADLSALPARFEQTTFALSWPALGGAVSYRTQVSEQADFSTLAFDRVSSGPKVTLSGLPDGDYHITVRATDQYGLEGLDGRGAFVLDARPEPPVTIAPQQDEIARANPPAFRWARTAGATAYHFQVARDRGFADLIADMPDLRDTEIRLSDLENGDYFWRVSLTDAGGDIGPFCPPIQFEMRVPPQSLPLEEPEVTDEQVTLSWARVAGVRYVFQLARDPGFDNIMVNRVLDEPRITMPRLLGGRYFLRLATIDDTGYQSNFGPVAEVDLPSRW